MFGLLALGFLIYKKKKEKERRWKQEHE